MIRWIQTIFPVWTGYVFSSSSKPYLIIKQLFFAEGQVGFESVFSECWIRIRSFLRFVKLWNLVEQVINIQNIFSLINLFSNKYKREYSIYEKYRSDPSPAPLRLIRTFRLDPDPYFRWVFFNNFCFWLSWIPGKMSQVFSILIKKRRHVEEKGKPQKKSFLVSGPLKRTFFCGFPSQDLKLDRKANSVRDSNRD